MTDAGDPSCAPSLDEWRLLTRADHAAIFDLHTAAVAAVGQPDLVRPETDGFFADLLGGGGLILGMEDKAGLLAYGVLQWDLPPSEDLRRPLGLPATAPFAKLAGASVRPGCWGYGLHEAVIAARVEAARVRGLSYLYATAAPGNARSWTNLITQGFALCAMIEQYGGHLRFILHRHVVRPFGSSVTLEPRGWCLATDHHLIWEWLGQGAMGIAWRRPRATGLEIGWALPS